MLLRHNFCSSTHIHGIYPRMLYRINDAEKKERKKRKKKMQCTPSVQSADGSHGDALTGTPATVATSPPCTLRHLDWGWTDRIDHSCSFTPPPVVQTRWPWPSRLSAKSVICHSRFLVPREAEGTYYYWSLLIFMQLYVTNLLLLFVCLLTLSACLTFLCIHIDH